MAFKAFSGGMLDGFDVCLGPFFGDEGWFDDFGGDGFVADHDLEDGAGFSEVLVDVAHGDAGVEAGGEGAAGDGADLFVAFVDVAAVAWDAFLGAFQAGHTVVGAFGFLCEERFFADEGVFPEDGPGEGGFERCVAAGEFVAGEHEGFFEA